MFSYLQIKLLMLSEKQFCSGRKRVKIENGVEAFELIKRYKLDKKYFFKFFTYCIQILENIFIHLQIFSGLEYASRFKCYIIREKDTYKFFNDHILNVSWIFSYEIKYAVEV